MDIRLYMNYVHGACEFAVLVHAIDHVFDIYCVTYEMSMLWHCVYAQHIQFSVLHSLDISKSALTQTVARYFHFYRGFV